MTSIVPRLNRTYFREDGRYPVVIQIIRHRCKREFQTSYLMTLVEFDEFMGKPKPGRKKHSEGKSPVPSHGKPKLSPVPNRPAVARIRRQLYELQEEFRGICRQLHQSKGEGYTVQDISDSYRCRNDLSLFFVYADTLMGKLHHENRSGTAANYLSACRSFESFLQVRSLSFNDFTPELINRYSDFLEQGELCTNTRVFYLRQLRAIYNKALKEGVALVDLRPFRNQVLKEEKTRKRAICREEVVRISHADLSGRHQDLSLARDLFVASLCLRGMAFVDLCYLTKANIEGDYLCYKRWKSKQPLRIFIEKPLRDILKRYADPASAYLFPLVRGIDIRREYLNAKKRIGRRVRELGLIANTREPLTFYVVRHTWATHARDLGVDLPVISSCLGHTSEKTTRIYLADMDVKRLNSANRSVLNSLLNSDILKKKQSLSL